MKAECILYIDDFDKIDKESLMGKKNECFLGEDWSHIDFGKILETIKPRLMTVEMKERQIILKLKAVDF